MMTLICYAKRSPIGSFQGSLAKISAPEIAAPLLQDALNELSLDPLQIDELYIGSALTAGVGQAPARQVAIKGGLGPNTPCTTVGKVCGSGMKAIMIGDLQIRASEGHALIVGGMENMSQSPFLVEKMRDGLRLGHGQLIDSMIRDGLWDVYNDFHMGSAAEMCAKKYNLSREDQDLYAIESYKRAQYSISSGFFKNETLNYELKSRKGSITFDTDEEPFRFDENKFKTLRPAFEKDGTVSAGNASTINDGAALLVICSEAFAKKENLFPIARIVGQASFADKPEWFSTAPSGSMKSLLKKTNKKISDIDFWEINEAFAAVALANNQIMELDPKKVNVRGGAVALGHPIGCSGARIVVTLIHTLIQENKKWGVASVCIGGGESTSIMLEAL